MSCFNINEVKQDWFEYNKCSVLDDHNFDYIIHQCNCFHLMGGGVAKFIKNKWTSVYQTDLTTKKGDVNKLGTYNYTKVSDKLTVINLYSQYFPGYLGVDGISPATDYKSMYKGLSSIFNDINNSTSDNIKIGIPYLIGCGIAGGEYKKVFEIFKLVFSGSKNIKIYFCDIN